MEQKEQYQREILTCTKGRNVVDNNLELQCDNWDTDVDKYEENKHTFDHGFVVLPNGQKSKIPRYYVDWLKKNHPEKWEKYRDNNQT